MSKPILRVTTIEKFRRYLTEVSSYDTEQAVIATLSGEFKGNEYSRIGTAFHKIIEEGEMFLGHSPDPYSYDVNVDGHLVRFSNRQAWEAITYRNEHPGAFHEIRKYKDYGRAIVTGCADLIDGIELRDIKTKYSRVSDSDYIDSCQHRFYLDIFNADVFHYDLFIFEGYKVDKHGYDVRGLELKRHDPPITCYRYPDMEADNLRLVNLFMDFAESRNLTRFLKFSQ